MASSYLSKSASSGNSTTFTISVWIKRLITGTATQMFNAHKADSVAGHTNFGIDSNDRLDLSTWNVNVLTTNRKLRDTNGWYHLVVQVDSKLGLCKRISIFVVQVERMQLYKPRA